MTYEQRGDTGTCLILGFGKGAASSRAVQSPKDACFNACGLPFYINFFLTISSAMVEAKRRMRLRSPGKFRWITSVPESLAKA